jgi:predicted patatin/cPLA2 family phospholipase
MSLSAKKKFTKALVIEGGGMRGVFSAGLLDLFLEKKFDPFDAYFGVSAGACNLASHLAGQHKRNYRCYTKYMLDPRFFSFAKFLRGGHYMDLDWFWDHLAAVDTLGGKKASKKNLYVVATDVHTGKPVYVRVEEKTIEDLLKGSSALPLLYRNFVRVGEYELVDGGVTDSIPVQAAVERGARRVMVIRSQIEGYVKKSFVESRLLPLLFIKYPELRNAMTNREARYNDAVNYIKNPPKGVEIIEICPKVLGTGRTTRDMEIIEADYAEGRRAGLEAIRRWRNIN